MLEAIDGFILVLGTDGHILYTSESLASLLGYLPSSLHNTTLYEIVADGDKIPLYNTLNISHNSESSDQHQVEFRISANFQGGTYSPKVIDFSSFSYKFLII